MKITRHKRVQRYLSFYQNNFGFRSPYLVLLDGTFCREALKYKINIREQLPKYFASDVKIYTTICLVNEIEKLCAIVPDLYGGMVILKQFEVQRCGHEKHPVSGSECLISIIKNKQNHYFIGTQDQKICEEARSIPGTPLMYINFNAIILEKPSEASIEESERLAGKKADISEHQKKVLEDLKKKEFGESSEKPRKKKKKLKGANPLSCLKKKKGKQGQQPSLSSEPKMGRKRHRQRHRKKVAKHVKEYLKTLEN